MKSLAGIIQREIDKGKAYATSVNDNETFIRRSTIAICTKVVIVTRNCV